MLRLSDWEDCVREKGDKDRERDMFWSSTGEV